MSGDNLSLIFLGSMVWFLIASGLTFAGEALVTLFFHGRLKLAAWMFGGSFLSVVVFIVSVLVRPHKQGMLAPFLSGFFFFIALALVLVALFMPTIIAVRSRAAKTRLVIIYNVLGLFLPFFTLIAYAVALKRSPRIG
ncbi:MAG: hypothetical protein C0508_04090 [Cyanobacteria bacterium PR.023]|jgi:ABC-type transport system involved in multi-copper enzyme maturation permease subunit|nr:hypothetical protein [Cyanobacteria bacterium PR.023]MDQ5935164.1 hypothetical protein [Cyanobacteriota bacterium erpe_2018_sw_21hr_WHONDRS-SW48-000092_B_bin.40]